VGDIALLEPGEIVPCDGVFLSGHNVKCDESGATGESDAIKKVSYDECIALRGSEGGTHTDCFIVSGSKALEGVGKYVVVAVGTKSFNGRIMMGMSPFFFYAKAPAAPDESPAGDISSLLTIWERRGTTVSSRSGGSARNETLELFEAQIATNLAHILDSWEARHSVLLLQGHNAQAFLDAVQHVGLHYPTWRSQDNPFGFRC
jgi:hypothetical protein